MGEPRAEDVITPDAMTLALRATFRPEAAGGLRAGYELRVGEVVVHARVQDGTLEAGEGPLPGTPDLVIETGPAIRALLAGDLEPDQAVRDGCVRLTGDPALLAPFVEAFRILPEPAALPD
jgi:hypothetical protein